MVPEITFCSAALSRSLFPAFNLLALEHPALPIFTNSLHGPRVVPALYAALFV